MKKKIKKFIGINSVVKKRYIKIQEKYQNLTFPGSLKYWELRYRRGGTSGAGSFGRLAEFKAQVLNSFVGDNNVKSVIEFGCGDGNQLSLANYPSYIGLDISSKAIELCKKRFKEDKSKSFFIYDPVCFVDNHGLFRTDLAISLDVIYHLVEDEIYEAHMSQLFNSGKSYVIIYSSDHDEYSKSRHVRHRNFSSWVELHYTNWSLLKKIKNKYSIALGACPETSKANFFIYNKIKSKNID
jgi:SAM-dependent methyltransferase